MDLAAREELDRDRGRSGTATFQWSALTGGQAGMSARVVYDGGRLPVRRAGCDRPWICSAEATLTPP